MEDPTMGEDVTSRVRELYERAGLSTRKIAETLDLTRRQVDRALRAGGVTVAPRGAGRARPRMSHPDLLDIGDQLRPLYERDGLSTRQIAQATGISRQRVERALAASGLDIAPRGAGRPRPSRRHVDPDDLGDQLRALYEEARLPRRQVSEKLGLTEGLVRDRLTEYGIPMRTRGHCSREDRRDIPEDELIRLYQDRGLSAHEAGEVLGVSRRIVLRAAHDHGIAVRPGASTRHASAPIHLVAALYADPLVRRTLERHGLPVVPAGGPIWERFPRPVAASIELWSELYFDCGASLTQIELLTGQPAGTVRRQLLAAGATLRPAGGRSPLRLRWEKEQRRRDQLAVRGRGRLTGK
jgi:transposase